MPGIVRAVAGIIRANGGNSLHQFVFNSNEFLVQTIPATARIICAIGVTIPSIGENYLRPAGIVHVICTRRELSELIRNYRIK